MNGNKSKILTTTFTFSLMVFATVFRQFDALESAILFGLWVVWAISNLMIWVNE